jgi:D-glycero-D-manno-heptose 1,7-bisphosphate phosphatase
MGPAHRRADSRRSARKNSGYTPWHLLPAAAREAKKKRPSRTPAKKRRAAAPARSPSPTQRPRPLPPVVALLAALAAALLLADAARRVALLVGVSAAAPVQRSPCNRICRRNPSFMDGTVCVGCMLSDDEIRRWSSFNSREREWALLDAAERRSAWEEYSGVTASDVDYGGFAATTDGADATDAYGGFEQTDAVPRPWTVLLDRDGVLNKDVGSPGVVREEQFELLPGVSDAVRALKEDGHACMVVTNQNARRKGLLSAETLDKLHASLRKEVPVDDIFVGTGLDAPALKPSPELVNLALESCGGDREYAVLVGDSRTDMIAACRAGVLAVLVTSSHHGVACAAELAEEPTPAVIDGGAPGGLLREGASVAAVFPGLPQALAAIQAHASLT